jgi:hypothetical protein
MQIGTPFPWFASVSKKRSWGANPGGRQSAKVWAYPSEQPALVSGIEKLDACTFFINLSLWLGRV